MRLRRYEGRPSLILAIHPWRWPFVTRLNLRDTLEARAYRDDLVYVPVSRLLAERTLPPLLPIRVTECFPSAAHPLLWEMMFRADDLPADDPPAGEP